MRTYRIKRLWKNLASVRDFFVKECIEEKEGLTILCDNDQMIIPAEELEKRAFQAHKTKMKSKWGSKDYELIDFVWSPTQ